MIKPLRTWILVADAAQARIVENCGVGRGVTAVDGAEFTNEVKHGRDLYADREGRVADRAGQGRHAMERPTDAKEQSATAFARELAAHLQDNLRRRKYDRLILIADPSFLGHLRVALPKTVTAVVHAEISKDLTKVRDDRLASHLEPVLAV